MQPLFVCNYQFTQSLSHPKSKLSVNRNHMHCKQRSAIMKTDKLYHPCMSKPDRCRSLERDRPWHEWSMLCIATSDLLSLQWRPYQLRLCMSTFVYKQELHNTNTLWNKSCKVHLAIRRQQSGSSQAWESEARLETSTKQLQMFAYMFGESQRKGSRLPRLSKHSMLAAPIGRNINWNPESISNRSAWIPFPLFLTQRLNEGVCVVLLHRYWSSLFLTYFKDRSIV